VGQQNITKIKTAFFGIFMLVAPQLGTQRPNTHELDAPNSHHTRLLQNPNKLVGAKNREIIRQSAIILNHNYIDKRRVGTAKLSAAGFSALAHAYPQSVEFASGQIATKFFTSANEISLCKSAQGTAYRLCEPKKQSSSISLSAKPLQEKNLLRIGENVYALTQNDLTLSQLINKHSHIPRLVAQVALESGENESAVERIFLNGILSELDPHSAFLNKDEYRELKNGTQGLFEGVGIMLRGGSSLSIVDDVVRNSAAEKAGIFTGDIIISVAETPTLFTPVEEVVERLRALAAKGRVPVWVYRPSSETVFSTFLSKEEIDTPTVETEEIAHKPGVIYVRIKSFSDETSEDLQTTLQALRADEPGKVLILDLRGNPGGLLDEAVEVADLFLEPASAIVSVRTRFENQREAASYREKFTAPMAVLVDSGSASASEIVAGALRDHGRALIVGERTYGKGSVQSLFETGGNEALKLTVAHYFTPSGHSIQGRGIVPHVVTRTITRHGEGLWIPGTAEDERENGLPFRLENPGVPITNAPEIATDSTFTVWTEKPAHEMFTGTPEAPLSPRRILNWQQPRTVEADFSLRVALSMLEILENKKNIPPSLGSELIQRAQSQELKNMSSWVRTLLKAKQPTEIQVTSSLNKRETTNEFEFTIRAKENPPKILPVLVHLNGHPDGPTLIVNATRHQKSRTGTRMIFRVPNIVNTMRSLVNEKRKALVSISTSLLNAEIPVGELPSHTHEDPAAWPRPQVMVSEKRPCKHDSSSACTPVTISMSHQNTSSTLDFSLVPFLSDTKTGVFARRSMVKRDKKNEEIIEVEIPSETGLGEKNKGIGIVAGIVKKQNGEVMGGWPILAVKNGVVESFGKPPRE
jgi:carboxyl-terminal processing protease